jgi:hypothetical protein
MKIQPEFRKIRNQEDLENLIPGDALRLAIPPRTLTRLVRFYRRESGCYEFLEKINIGKENEAIQIFSIDLDKTKLNFVGYRPKSLESSCYPSYGLIPDREQKIDIVYNGGWREEDGKLYFQLSKVFQNPLEIQMQQRSIAINLMKFMAFGILTGNVATKCYYPDELKLKDNNSIVKVVNSAPIEICETPYRINDKGELHSQYNEIIRAGNPNCTLFFTSMGGSETCEYLGNSGESRIKVRFYSNSGETNPKNNLDEIVGSPNIEDFERRHKRNLFLLSKAKLL